MNHNLTCPDCGGQDISAEVKTWCRFSQARTTETRAFDDEDLDYVELVPDGERVCHDCGHCWTCWTPT